MGPAFSILGILFISGMLLFMLLILLMAASTKGGGGLSGRPILTALLFSFAIALMAGPAITSTMGSTYSNEHAFRMFFGRQPGTNVKFLNNASGGGVDYSTIILSFELGQERKFETFAASARLKLSPAAKIPEAAFDVPEWWTPGDCPSTPEVFIGAPDSTWNEKWAAFCVDTRRIYAYASWTE